MTTLTAKQVKDAIPVGVVPFFQPIVATSGVISYEALGRLVVSGETLAPGQFMPFLEGLALEAEFDREVTAKAIAQVAKWNAHRSVPVHIHVNASSQTLRDPGYVHFLREMLAAHRLAPELLTVEVVETCAFWKQKEVLATLSAVRWVGVQIAIDDFPCWEDPEALLSWLERDTVGISALKLDRSLVQDACRPDAAPVVLREVQRYVRLARQRGMTVVAEGVENDEQALAMQLLGADALQGFGIGRPCPAETAYHHTHDLVEVQLALRTPPADAYDWASAH